MACKKYAAQLLDIHDLPWVYLCLKHSSASFYATFLLCTAKPFEAVYNILPLSCDYTTIMDKTSHFTTFLAVRWGLHDRHLLKKVQCSAWLCVKSRSGFLQEFVVHGTLKVHGSLKVALVVSVTTSYLASVMIFAFFFNCWVLQWRFLLFKRLLTAKTRKTTLIWGDVWYIHVPGA